MFILQVVRNILTTTEASTAYDMLMRIIDRGADFQLVRSAMFFCAYFTFGIEQLTSLKYRKRELMQAMCDVSDLTLILWLRLFISKY